MRVRTTNHFTGEVKGLTTVIDVDYGESVDVEPGPGQRAVVLLIAADTESTA